MAKERQGQHAQKPQNQPSKRPTITEDSETSARDDRKTRSEAHRVIFRA
mgnify:CR=1 FL=1